MYDDAGNRLTALAAGVTTNFAYTADGQLCDVETAPTAASCSGGNITYDTAGRTRSWNGWWLSYDAAGRLTNACRSATCAGGFDKVEMAYDSEGHRIQTKTTNAAGAVATRDFRYQGQAIVEERLTDTAHPAGTVVRTYIPDEAGATVRMVIPPGEPGSGNYLVAWNGHGDALGLWRHEADGSLTRANTYQYDTWGKPTTVTHNGIPDLGFRFLYVGRFDVQWDNDFGLGLTYMHARHYSPALGRFLQPDPSRAEANPYAYAFNSPVTVTDSTGEKGGRGRRIGTRVHEVTWWDVTLWSLGPGVICSGLSAKPVSNPYVAIGIGLFCGLIGNYIAPREGDKTVTTAYASATRILIVTSHYRKGRDGHIFDYSTYVSYRYSEPY